MFQRISDWCLRRRDQKIEEAIAAMAKEHEHLTLVQIGSNDGKTNDPFYPHLIAHGWSALLVEPVPYVFQRLQDTHRNTPGVILENVAVSDCEEIKQFYHLRHSDAKDTPWWYDQIGSFDREQVLKSREEIPGIEQLLTATPVGCTGLVRLLEKHRIEQIDIFHTDVEGYDFQVLRQLDFARWRPKLLLYEHKHLSSSKRVECASFMQKHSYGLIVGAADTLAVDQHRR